MKTLVQHTETLPDGASSDQSNGTWKQIWCHDDGGYRQCIAKSETGGSMLSRYDGAPETVVQNKGWHPVLSTLPNEQSALRDWGIRAHEPLWEYWITTPTEYLGGVKQGGVKDFVAAAVEGSLPTDWAEQAAEDGSGTAYTVCSFSMTMDQVRALGSEQRSLQTLGSTPSDVHFFQRVADIDGFSGIERVSRQPNDIESQLYAPTELYQTSHPDAGDARGNAFTEGDVLEVTGLTLV